MATLNTNRSVNRAIARAGVDRAVVESEAIGCTCIAVVDSAGNLVSHDRMDGAPYNSAIHAQEKAYSAAGNGVATMAMWTAVEAKQQLALGILKVKGLSVLGGGVPLVLGEEIVGAVGVSGSCGQDEDHAIATAAAAAIIDAIHSGS